MPSDVLVSRRRVCVTCSHLLCCCCLRRWVFDAAFDRRARLVRAAAPTAAHSIPAALSALTTASRALPSLPSRPMHTHSHASLCAQGRMWAMVPRTSPQAKFRADGVLPAVTITAAAIAAVAATVAAVWAVAADAAVVPVVRCFLGSFWGLCSTRARTWTTCGVLFRCI